MDTTNIRSFPYRHGWWIIHDLVEKCIKENPCTAPDIVADKVMTDLKQCVDDRKDLERMREYHNQDSITIRELQRRLYQIEYERAEI